MSAFEPPANPANDPTQQVEDARQYREILHELMEVGLEIARGLCSQTRRNQQAGRKHEPAPSLHDVAIAFDRGSRAVRRGIILAERNTWPSHRTGQRVPARQRIIREIESAIERAESRRPRVEALHAELLDGLDAPDLDRAIFSRPAPDIIADICRDLGLVALVGTSPWRRRTPSEVEALCARATRKVVIPRDVVTAPPAVVTRPAPAPIGRDRRPELGSKVLQYPPPLRKN